MNVAKPLVLAVMLLAVSPARADLADESPLLEDENGLAADDAGDPVGALEFFRSVSGGYQIELVAGAKPKPGIDRASVEIDGPEAVLTMPYCPPNGGCDPGYVYFPLDRTRVYRRVFGGASVLHTLVVTEAGKASRYLWRNDGGRIFFSNPQYTVGNQVLTLEHVLAR